MLRRAARIGAKTVGATTVLATAGVGGLASYDPGFRRQCSFWATVLPGVCSYRYASWKYPADTHPELRTQKFEELHVIYAPVAFELIQNCENSSNTSTHRTSASRATSDTDSLLTCFQCAACS